MSETLETVSKLRYLTLALFLKDDYCEPSRNVRQRGTGEMTWNILIHAASNNK